MISLINVTKIPQISFLTFLWLKTVKLASEITEKIEQKPYLEEIRLCILQ